MTNTPPDAPTVTELAAELGIPVPRLSGYLAAYAEQADRDAVTEDGRVAAWAAAEARTHAADWTGRLRG